MNHPVAAAFALTCALVRVASAETIRVRSEIPVSTAFRGAIRDSVGRVLTGVELAMFRAPGDEPVARSRTDDLGRHAAPGLSPGAHRVAVMQGESVLLWRGRPLGSCHRSSSCCVPRPRPAKIPRRRIPHGRSDSGNGAFCATSRAARLRRTRWIGPRDLLRRIGSSLERSIRRSCSRTPHRVPSATGPAWGSRPGSARRDRRRDLHPVLHASKVPERARRVFNGLDSNLLRSRSRRSTGSVNPPFRISSTGGVARLRWLDACKTRTNRGNIAN